MGCSNSTEKEKVKKRPIRPKPDIPKAGSNNLNTSADDVEITSVTPKKLVEDIDNDSSVSSSSCREVSPKETASEHPTTAVASTSNSDAVRPASSTEESSRQSSIVSPPRHLTRKMRSIAPVFELSHVDTLRIGSFLMNSDTAGLFEFIRIQYKFDIARSHAILSWVLQNIGYDVYNLNDDPFDQIVY